MLKLARFALVAAIPVLGMLAGAGGVLISPAAAAEVGSAPSVDVAGGRGSRRDAAGKTADRTGKVDRAVDRTTRRGEDSGKAGKSSGRSGKRGDRETGRGGSRGAIGGPVEDRVTADPDDEPSPPVRVDDPIPKPRDPDPVAEPDDPVVEPDDSVAEPDDPVEPDDTVETPDDPVDEPTVPVRVDDPIPEPDKPATPTPNKPVTPAPNKPDGDAVAETPADPVEPGRSSSDETRRLQAQIGDLLRGRRLTIPGAGSDDHSAKADETAATDGENPAGTQSEAPAAVAESNRAAAATAALAAEVARAPRIALSSGGGGSSYRQHEISVLGLTPKSRQVIGALGFRILSERRSGLLGNRIVARLRTPRDQTAEVAIARVRGLLPELTFDYAHLYRPSGDAGRVRYAADMVGAPAPGSCRIDARIGLIDSGVGQHPSLARAAITRRNFVSKDAATNVAHGTAIASIMVGDLPGTGALAPGARVFSANVFAQGSDGLRADAHAIIAALDWLASERVPVVNLSLMGPPDALLEEAVQAAAQRGLILVAAAGNDGPVAAPAYPAAYPAVIAVAAVDARGRPYGGNNRGSYVYVSAPGVDVWGADARGGQAFWTGTSFAAPFVTATLARDVALGRAHDINDGRIRIASSARDLGAPGRDPVYGFGLLQVGDCSGTGAPVLSSKN